MSAATLTTPTQQPQPQPRRKDRLLPPAEAACRLGANPRSIAVWIKSGKLRGIITPGGHARAFESAVDELMGLNAETSGTECRKEEV